MSEHKVKEEIAASLKYDAKKHRRCKTCACWDNPDGRPMGMCIRNPGIAFLVMQAPPNALALPGRVPAGPQPSVVSSAIPKGPEDGCFQWQRRIEDLH